MSLIVVDSLRCLNLVRVLIFSLISLVVLKFKTGRIPMLERASVDILFSACASGRASNLILVGSLGTRVLSKLWFLLCSSDGMGLVLLLVLFSKSLPRSGFIFIIKLLMNITYDGYNDQEKHLVFDDQPFESTPHLSVYHVKKYSNYVSTYRI